MKALAWIAGILLFLIFVGNAQECGKKKPTTREDVRLWVMTATAAMLRDKMRNPDSFKLESVFLISGTGSICYSYRVQNGFGGMNNGQAVLAGAQFDPELSSQAVLAKAEFKTSEESGFDDLWNGQCAGKSGEEKVELVKIAMSMASP